MRRTISFYGQLSFKNENLGYKDGSLFKPDRQKLRLPNCGKKVFFSGTGKR